MRVTPSAMSKTATINGVDDAARVLNNCSDAKT